MSPHHRDPAGHVFYIVESQSYADADAVIHANGENGAMVV